MIIDFKSPDHPIVADELIKKILSDPSHKAPSSDPKGWLLYCNDKKVSSLRHRIRKRSKMNLFYRNGSDPKIEVVFENTFLVVLNKPAGLPTQKTLKSFEDNLYDQVRHFYLRQKNFPIGLPYVGLHHRLDRGTSGLVVMSKQRQVNKELGDLFKNRKIQKTYLAETQLGSKTPEKSWLQKDKIKRSTSQKLKFFFEVADSGDEAITEFRLLETQSDSHLFHCFPKTGRTHQIRVQLAHKGYPIVGDRVYGQKAPDGLMRLHAEKLQFSLKGESFQFQVPAPW